MPLPANPYVQQLFQPPAQAATTNTAPLLTPGNLLLFQYKYWLHDPSPMIILVDSQPGNKIRGLNLHYLTFPYVKMLLSRACNTGFSYQNIKGDGYIKGAFRSYKWSGVTMVKKLDCQFILRMMSVARTFNPSEVHAIRQSIEQQLQQEFLRKATPTGEINV